MADLELRGKAEGTASLEILGKLNPLAKPLALDITGKVRDLELPADRNGVIDLDLPISDSLNDPQFSLGPIIVKVILNVIVKAITAPFSLLAHALGGSGEELSMVGFPTGSAQLSSEVKSGLDKVAKDLTERPTLRLTVIGTSSLEAEREAFKRARLDDMVRAEKRRQLDRQGAKPDEEGVSVSPAEYPALLKEVYKHADFPKPRNLIGLTKDIPVPEMENLLLASIKADDEAMHALAEKRGAAVRNYLASRDLPLARLFLGAVKAEPPGAKWTPRAELNLAMP